MKNSFDSSARLCRGIVIALALASLASCGGASPTAAGSSGGTADPGGGGTAAPGGGGTPTPVQGAFSWKPLRIGAGGLVTGIDIAPDGTKVVRTDTAGAYIWSESKAEWTALLTNASMPRGTWGFEATGQLGAYEVAIAPSNSNRIYVIFDSSVFRTDDKGRSFVKTGLVNIPAVPDDDFRHYGKKMAVDPVNPDVVLVGSQTKGLYISANSGQSWSEVTSVPRSATANGMRVCFDPSSPVRAGKTSRIYASTEGGVYVSNDAGVSFVGIAGSPATTLHLVCAKNGIVWATSSVDGKVYRLTNGLWSAVGPTNTRFKTIAVDPANSSHVVIATDGGNIAQTYDGGSNWLGIYWKFAPVNSGRRIASDIPWLASTLEDYMSSGEMVFDPSASNKLYFAEGIGVWWSNPPSSETGFDWNSQSKGIEQLVSNQFLSPPGGTPLYLAWDRPLFQIQDPDKFPTGHGPNYSVAINMGWSADYVAAEPKTIVGLFNWWGVEQSGYSTDGGTTWTKFASVPADVAASKIGGAIAAGGPENFVWVPSNNASPWFTRDRGRTWNRSSIPGVPTTGETGWGWSYYLHRLIVAADRVDPNTFYVYNYLDQVGGLFRSTDGGATFVRAFNGPIAPSSGFNAKLASVPGKKGQLFFTSGNQSGPHPSATNFMRSVDGGTTWTAVAGMQEVAAFGFGAAAPSQTYPSIYVAGYYNGTYGVWRSDDNAISWTNLGDYPLDIAYQVTAISGDANVYGRVYLGFIGNGAVYGGFASPIAGGGGTGN